MRNFFKQWKSKTLVDALKQIAEDKKMRFSHAYRYPRYPFVNESVDQAEQIVLKTQVPGKNLGGRP